MKYQYQLVRINKQNYPLFDDMLFWRETGFERVALQNSVYKSIKKELKNKNLYVYAVEIENRFVGWISLVYIPKISKWKNGGHLYVDELWIAPAFRGLGLAKILMNQAESLQKKLGAVGIRLYVNTENETAKGLYSACGYKENGNAVFMDK